MFFSTLQYICTTLLLAQVASNTIIHSSDGTEIYASAVGKSSNPPIVFVHGFSYSALVFDDLVKDERLLSRYYMISYDLRGHGRSGKPNTTEAYISKRFSDDFAVVTNHFEVKSPLFLGWSYGGTIATDIFSNLPANTISGVFAIAAFPAIELALGTPFSLQLVPAFSVPNDVALDIDTKYTFMQSCFNNASNIPTQTQWSWLGSSVLQLPPISDLLNTRIQNTTILFEAGARGIPYMAISGTDDKLVANDNVTQALRPHFTNLEVHSVEGGSHALFVDNKDEVVQVLITFADKVFKKAYGGA